MQKFFCLALVLGLCFSHVSPALSAEESAGFFGIKKFMQKDEHKKKPLLSQPVKKTAVGSSKLTEEEKKLVKEMASKMSDRSRAGEKEAVRLSQTALIAQRVPKAPVVTPRAPISIPKNPNASIVRIPQPPPKVPGANPNAVPRVPSVPESKKK